MRAFLSADIKSLMPSPWCYGLGLWSIVWLSFGLGGPVWFPLFPQTSNHLWTHILAVNLALALGCLILALLRRRILCLREHRGLLAGAALVESIGVVIVGLAGAQYLGAVWLPTGLALIGAGAAPGMLAWFELYCSIGVQKTAAAVAGAQLMGAAFYLLVGLLGRSILPMAIVALACMPALSLAAYCMASRGPGRQPLDPPSRSKPFRMPGGILAGMFIYGAVFGFVLSLIAFSASAESDAPSSIQTLGVAATSVALLAYAVFSRDFDLVRVYRWVLPLLVVGLLLLSVLLGTSPLIASVVMLAGHSYFRNFSIALYSHIAESVPAPPLAVVSQGSMADPLGFAAGSLLCTVLVAGTDVALSPLSLSLVSLVAVSAQVLTSTFLFNEHAVRTLWGRVVLESREDVLAKRCAEVAATCCLTPREGEILLMLVQGRDAEQIRRTLTLSLATVRTHIFRIHQKLQVHSRRELMDLVEEVLAEGNAVRCE